MDDNWSIKFTDIPLGETHIDFGTGIQTWKPSASLKMTEEEQRAHNKIGGHNMETIYFGRPPTFEEEMFKLKIESLRKKHINKGYNMFAKLALKFCRGYILRKIDTDSFKGSLANAVNDKVDLPKLNEKEEKALFLAVITALIALLKRL